MSQDDKKVFVFSLDEDPIWEVNDVRVLTLTQDGVESGPTEYRVTARNRIDDQVRYELKPYLA